MDLPADDPCHVADVLKLIYTGDFKTPVESEPYLGLEKAWLPWSSEELAVDEEGCLTAIGRLVNIYSLCNRFMLSNVTEKIAIEMYRALNCTGNHIDQSLSGQSKEKTLIRLVAEAAEKIYSCSVSDDWLVRMPILAVILQASGLKWQSYRRLREMPDLMHDLEKGEILFHKLCTSPDCKGRPREVRWNCTCGKCDGCSSIECKDRRTICNVCFKLNTCSCMVRMDRRCAATRCDKGGH